MKSRIFSTGVYHEIEQRLLTLLNAQQEFLSPRTLNSTRAAGDAIQEIISNSFEAIIGDWCAKYSTAFACRAMADLAFIDVDDFYYVVDVKTHRADTKFNMPNLTSVERLARFYEDDKNYFVLLVLQYHLEISRAIFTNVHFVPIEFLDWSCLTIGALGWGQIQIANSNRIVINSQSSRKKWMLELCDILAEFYPREIAKISARIQRFEALRSYWLTKPD
jgi:hypothetical protein